MIISTKPNFFRILLIGIGLLLLCSLVFNYLGYRSEAVLFLRISNIQNYDFSHHAKSRAERVNISKPELIDETELPMLHLCQDPNLKDSAGPITPNKTSVSLAQVEAELSGSLQPGGAFAPPNCTVRHHVAIIVPFRNRYLHLAVFLRNMHPFLQRQNIAYRIFLIEQSNGKGFNHGALTNIGFLEALKLYNWDCFIFHDADLLPLDNRNVYNCPRHPRHMSVAIDKFNFHLPYWYLIGGVSAMTRAHVESVNGFSNYYFGWGGEDDDMFKRLNKTGHFISRYPKNIARYTMLAHKREKQNSFNRIILRNSETRYKIDGLSTIEYEILNTQELPLYTWYLVELKNIPQKIASK